MITQADDYDTNYVAKERINAKYRAVAEAKEAGKGTRKTKCPCCGTTMTIVVANTTETWCEDRKCGGIILD